MKFYSQKKSGGFTLVEAMVAIAILATALTSAMVLVQRGLQTTFNARDQVNAFYLAQDALEQIRSMRDTNKLTEASWLASLDPCVSPTGTAHCKISNFDSFGTYQLNIQSCINPTCGEFLNYIPTLGIYGYFNSGAGGPAFVNSTFQRDITITSPVGSDADEARVRVSVSWRSGTVRKNITLTTYLRNI